MLEFARLLHVHALFITPPVECLVKQPLPLHEVDLQSIHHIACPDSVMCIWLMQPGKADMGKHIKQGHNQHPCEDTQITFSLCGP